MASPKSSSEKKPKLAKPLMALPVEMEEIEIKLGSAGTAFQQTEENPQTRSAESSQLKLEIDVLKNVNQKTQDEIETLRQYVQVVEEKLAKEFEAQRKEQRQAEQQRLQVEAQIRSLEKNIAMLMEPRTEKTPSTVISSTLPVAKSASSTESRAVAQAASRQQIPAQPQPPANISAEKIYKNVGAQVSTMAFATPQGLTVHSTFRLSGADALMLAHDRLPFQVSWYAHKLGGGDAMLLTTSDENLTENKLEYMIKTDAPPLVSGPYRLTTIATFPTVRNLIAHCQGPVIQ